MFEYGSASIPEFIEAHPDLFKYKFGAGMHSWKPYIILKALDNIKDGDWLFYCDCGAEIIDDVHKLIFLLFVNRKVPSLILYDSSVIINTMIAPQ